MIIDGIIVFPSMADLDQIKGSVCLEDVSLADAPSHKIAHLNFSVLKGCFTVEFKLHVPAKLDPSRDYAISVEADAVKTGTGLRVKMGTVASYPWKPDAPAKFQRIDVKCWSVEKKYGDPP
jgi:hypothetical protein